MLLARVITVRSVKGNTLSKTVGMKRRIAALAPGYAASIERRGLVPATVALVDPRRLSPRRRQQAVVGGVARGLPVRPALEMARALSAAGKDALALEALEGVLVRFPTNTRALAERAAVRHRHGQPGVFEDLVLAVRGDLSSSSLVAVATAAMGILDSPQLEALRSDIATIDLPQDASDDRELAMHILAVAARFRTGEELGLGRGAPNLPAAVLTLLAIWAREDVRWDVLPAIEEAILRREADGEILDGTRVRLTEALRTKGDISHSVEVARGAGTSNRDATAATYVSMGQAELTILRDGWTAPVRGARVAARPGAMAYLLHNSLPYTSGGYATRSHGLLASLVRRGWDVSAVTRPRYPLDRPEGARLVASQVALGNEIDGVRYTRITRSASARHLEGQVGYFADKLCELAEVEQWGVVHGASNHPLGLAANAAAARIGVPSVYEVRGLWEITRMSREPEYEHTERFDLTARLEAQACMQADHAFALTNGLRDLMISRGVPAEHISVLPNGVDVSRFTPTATNARLKDRLGLRGKVVIGYVGSVVDYEGLELLVDATRLLVDAGLPVALLIVGDGAALASVKARVSSVGLDDIAVMPGRVPHAEAEAYYSVIDIAPFPRLPLPVTELVSPLKPFEAMAMGKPVVVSSVAALAEIVTDSHNGRVFDKGNVDSLAAVLTELVTTPDERQRLGDAARTWVVEHRSWDQLSGRIVEVYERLGVPLPSR